MYHGTNAIIIIFMITQYSGYITTYILYIHTSPNTSWLSFTLACKHESPVWCKKLLYSFLPLHYQQLSNQQLMYQNLCYNPITYNNDVLSALMYQWPCICSSHDSQIWEQQMKSGHNWLDSPLCFTNHRQGSKLFCTELNGWPAIMASLYWENITLIPHWQKGCER